LTAPLARQATQHTLSCGILQLDIKRSIDAQTTFMYSTSSVFLFQITPYFLDEIRGDGIFCRLDIEDYGRGLGAIGHLGSDLAVFKHVIDHDITALQGALRIGNRRVEARSFWQSRKQGRLFKREFFGRFIEVVLRAGFKSINAMAQKDLVAVHGKNLLLSEVALDLDGEHHLLNLAAEVALRRKKQVARKLHGQRGRTLGPRAGGDVAPGRPEHAPEIDAPVLFEALVFSRENGVPQDPGKLIVRSENAALQSKRADDLSVCIVEFGNRAGTVTLQIADLGKISGVDNQQAGEGADERRGQQQQSKDHSAYQLFPADIYLGKI